MRKSRFQTFVALRYLMAHPIHESSLTAVIGGVILLAGVALRLIGTYLLEAPDPHALIETGSPYRSDVLMAGTVCLFVYGFVLYVFLVRSFFTFYSTVSIVGVSVGAAALVIVLSIMNGFESDLREKILGSNAHIQITKEDGEFLEWQDVRERIAGVPGVVASTPYATSEVVIAANSNYFNVVVKGIDVETAVQVSDLARVLRTATGIPDPHALDRLQPLVPDEFEVPEVVAPPVDPDREVIDPAPPDLPGGGDPIDFSGPPEPAGKSDEPDRDPRAPPAADDYGGAARVLLGPDVDHGEDVDEGVPAPAPAPGSDLDPAPDDFTTGPDPLRDPIDYSHATAGDHRPIRVQTLPGVLVGRELRKQIHLFTEQEVRLVSPLADPMNPDANGTPIPYNRDYRVAGEFYTGMYEYDLKLVYVSLDSLQQFLRMGDAVDGIEVRIRDADAVDDVAAAITRRLDAGGGPHYRVQGWRELNRNLFSALKLEKIAMFLVLAIIILVASFSIVGNLIMTVLEKGKEIALLKTLGATDEGIVGVFVMQGFLIGTIGTSLGVAFGLVGSWALAAFGFPLNADVYYIDRLPIQVDPRTVLLIYSSGLIISVAATVYPAILAARLRPAVGLKNT